MTLPRTIPEVIRQLEQIISDCANRGIRQGYFAALYLRVTKEVDRKIREKYFDDNARMEQLDVIFANRFIMAYYQYQQKQSCVTSWSLAFDACNKWPPLVMQHLLLGMNAHISLDLGIAAATVCSGSSIHNLQNDFNKINTILAGLVDIVQEELCEIWSLLKPVDWLAGRIDEKVAVFSMNIARDAAWNVALQYALLNEPEQQNDFIRLRDEKVFAFGKRIIQHSFPVNFYIGVSRLLEKGTVARKINILNRA